MEDILSNENTAGRRVDSLCIFGLDDTVCVQTITRGIRALRNMLLDVEREFSLCITVVSLCWDDLWLCGRLLRIITRVRAPVVTEDPTILSRTFRSTLLGGSMN
jgi:hypothetical protein